MKNLDKLSDHELVKRIQDKSCSRSMEILLDKHSKIFYDAIHRYIRKHKEANRQDLLDDIYIVFNRAVDSFKFDKKTKFTTWLSYHGYWHCLNSNKQYGKTMNFANEDIDLINEKQNKYVTFANNIEEINAYIYNILEQLDDKRIKKIFAMRFIEGGKKNKLMAWSRIAPRLGISISHAINLYQKGQKFLYNKMNSKDNYDSV